MNFNLSNFFQQNCEIGTWEVENCILEFVMYQF